MVLDDEPELEESCLRLRRIGGMVACTKGGDGGRV
jgi:hypothetical protein